MLFNRVTNIVPISSTSNEHDIHLKRHDIYLKRCDYIYLKIKKTKTTIDFPSEKWFTEKCPFTKYQYMMNRKSPLSRCLFQIISKKRWELPILTSRDCKLFKVLKESSSIFMTRFEMFLKENDLYSLN